MFLKKIVAGPKPYGKVQVNHLLLCLEPVQLLPPLSQLCCLPQYFLLLLAKLCLLFQLFAHLCNVNYIYVFNNVISGSPPLERRVHLQLVS